MGRIYGAVPAIFTGSGFYKTDRGMKWQFTDMK
jgi:predicted nucleic acid-binding Zn ribbon protein